MARSLARRSAHELARIDRAIATLKYQRLCLIRQARELILGSPSTQRAARHAEKLEARIEEARIAAEAQP